MSNSRVKKAKPSTSNWAWLSILFQRAPLFEIAFLGIIIAIVLLIFTHLGDIPSILKQDKGFETTIFIFGGGLFLALLCVFGIIARTKLFRADSAPTVGQQRSLNNQVVKELGELRQEMARYNEQLRNAVEQAATGMPNDRSS